MFTREQLEFIQRSITQERAAVPVQENGKVARIFVSVLDEIDAQLRDLPVNIPALPDVKA